MDQEGRKESYKHLELKSRGEREASRSSALKRGWEAAGGRTKSCFRHKSTERKICRKRGVCSQQFVHFEGEKKMDEFFGVGVGGQILGKGKVMRG